MQDARAIAVAHGGGVEVAAQQVGVVPEVLEQRGAIDAVRADVGGGRGQS
jgi:hypothetical protein